VYRWPNAFCFLSLSHGLDLSREYTHTPTTRTSQNFSSSLIIRQIILILAAAEAFHRAVLSVLNIVGPLWSAEAAKKRSSALLLELCAKKMLIYTRIVLRLLVLSLT